MDEAVSEQWHRRWPAEAMLVIPTAGYYRYWEKVFFEAVCTMLVTAVKSLHGMLSDVGDGNPEAGPGSSAAVPLFRVRLCPEP